MPLAHRNPQRARPHLEVLEDRLACSTTPLLMAAIGDSTTVERGGNNWTEQLAQSRGVSFGPSELKEEGGVEFPDYENIVAGSPATMAANGALVAITDKVAAGAVSIVYLGGAGLDFATRYGDIYFGALTGAPLDAFIDSEVTALRSAMDTLSAAGPVKFVLENAGDFGITPFINQLNVLGPPIAEKKELVTNAVRSFNVKLQQLADERHVPVFDAFALGAHLTNAASPPVVGGYTLDVSSFSGVTSLQVINPLHLFIDSQHIGPVAQGIKANAILRTLDLAHGIGIEPFSDQEILAFAYCRAGLPAPPANPTSYFPVADFVQYSRDSSAVLNVMRTRIESLCLKQGDRMPLLANLRTAEAHLEKRNPQPVKSALTSLQRHIRQLEKTGQLSAIRANLFLEEVQFVLDSL